MRTTVDAEYDARQQAFRLLEPVEGLADREKVRLVIDTADGGRPTSLRGSLPKEAGEDLSRVIDAMFPIER